MDVLNWNFKIQWMLTRFIIIFLNQTIYHLFIVLKRLNRFVANYLGGNISEEIRLTLRIIKYKQNNYKTMLVIFFSSIVFLKLVNVGGLFYQGWVSVGWNGLKLTIVDLINDQTEADQPWCSTNLVVNRSI